MIEPPDNYTYQELPDGKIAQTNGEYLDGLYWPNPTTAHNVRIGISVQLTAEAKKRAGYAHIE